MSKFKRYIKNAFSIAGLEWRSDENVPLDQTGILLSKLNNKTASDRSRIADEQYMITIELFAENIIQPLLPGQPYNSGYPDGVVDKDVGNIPAGTPYSDFEGILVTELLDRIFFVSPPQVILDGGNAVVINIPADTVEVGEIMHFEGTALHTKGAIASANGALTVELKGAATLFTFEDATGITPIPAVTNSQAYIGTDFPAIQGDNTLSCTIDYAQGVGSYFDEAGNEMHSFDVLRAADNVLVTDSVIGAYKAWFGSGILGSTPIDSATARALGFTFMDNNGFKGQILYTIPAGDVEFYFSVPTGSIVSVLHFKQANTYLTPQFVITTFNINDAAGNPISYDTYSLVIGGVGFLEDAEMIVEINEDAI